ncbi:MAG TPA: YbjN domain-containing protein [Anaerolineae bacterium]|nr:YbjN domain-containing protein [Anaerolineae bacterium]HRA19453.1 YbjN domain-containing protein [Anaerolineae bacterium]
MDDQTRAFLGDTAGWQGAQLILDDVNGLWGGLRVTVRGDGNAYVTMVDVSLAEQHFWLPLGVDRALAVLDLAAQQDLLAVPVSGRVPVPDETSTRLQVINAAGETRTVVRWAHDDPDTRFDVVREGLMALRNDMQDLGARRIGSIPALGADDPAPPFQESPAMEGNLDTDRILQAFIDFFTDDDWRFDRSEQKPILRLSFQGRSGHTWNCFAQSRMGENTEQAIFYSVAPIKVPEIKRQDIAEYLTRANYGMVMGNFEMDYSDGEIRYKTSVDLAGGSQLTMLLTKPLVYTNVLMMDKYLPGVMEVLYAEVSPEQAIRKIEG